MVADINSYLLCFKKDEASTSDYKFDYIRNAYLDWQLQLDGCRGLILKFGGTIEEFNSNALLDNFYKYLKLLQRGATF